MKHIKTFENFIREFNGPNLSLNYNTNYDFISFQAKQFDGGDGNSATEVPEPFKQNVNKPIFQKGSNVKKKQEEREKKRKKYSREQKIAKLMKYQTDDDLIKNAPRCEPTINSN